MYLVLKLQGAPYKIFKLVKKISGEIVLDCEVLILKISSAANFSKLYHWQIGTSKQLLSFQ